MTQPHNPLPTPSPDPVPEPQTLLEALRVLALRGYRANLVPAEGGIRVAGEDAVIPTDAVEVEQTRRFEGLTNPGDQAILYGILLPSGARGALVLGYGPSASAEDAALLRALPEREPEPG